MISIQILSLQAPTVSEAAVLSVKRLILNSEDLNFPQLLMYKFATKTTVASSSGALAIMSCEKVLTHRFSDPFTQLDAQPPFSPSLCFCLTESRPLHEISQRIGIFLLITSLTPRFLAPNLPVVFHSFFQSSNAISALTYEDQDEVRSQILLRGETNFHQKDVHSQQSRGESVLERQEQP